LKKWRLNLEAKNNNLGDTLEIIVLAQDRKHHQENTTKDFGIFSYPKCGLEKRLQAQ